MLRSTGISGKQSATTFRDVDPITERGNILEWKSYFVSLMPHGRCMARQTPRNHNGYVIPQSFPPLPEVYEEPVTPTNLDHAQILQVSQPASHRNIDGLLTYF